MQYDFRAIEKKWQQSWKETGAYRVDNPSPEDRDQKPKYYVLDMFPYPSGVGLHVGHPLGYIASDIFARFKRLKGYNVLHPMGYDAFGLPAEQYAIEHGIHPALSTATNIANFRRQLDNIGFCFDWDREVRTSDPAYYKWTQWIFLQLFKSWYNPTSRKAESISSLISIFEQNGNAGLLRHYPIQLFTATEWKELSEPAKQALIMSYRLAYCGYGEVNWCEALGTVLANDEVINGLSERGGYPVVKKKLRQWYLRITAYADRLLEGLERVEFSEAMKEMQTNWIGKSFGAEIDFQLKTAQDNVKSMRVYTTRPDTIFGVDFMVVAPELNWVKGIVSPDQDNAVTEYIEYVKSRSERERQAEKNISGCFTGAYAVNPFNGREIPVWISEYVLAGYGTGAIMAVPCGDDRDFKFAQHFNIPITNIIGDAFNGIEANSTKDAKLSNSDFLDGIIMRDAIQIVNKKLEEKGIGTPKVNFRMRDAAFSRQRYWGEPFPITWVDGIASPLSETALPLELPHVDSYVPGPDGEGPLANIPSWTSRHLETNTMPGYAGSSWYFLRYMDPNNDKTFCDRNVSDYWGQVDLYVGGTEHAVGHLLYSRMWTKFLYDLGHIGFDEPFKRLLNQGMIQGSSRFVYRDKNDPDLFISQNLIGGFETTALYVDVNIVDGMDLDVAAFRKWRPEFSNARLLLDNGNIDEPMAPQKTAGKYICGSEVEKMSKRKFNTVDPDDLVKRFGADTFRMYEMFLGPVDQSKPWDTQGIEGVHRFLRKLWRLFYDEVKGKLWTDELPSSAEQKVLQKTIKKVEENTERFSFNTAVSALMIGVNELADLKCYKKQVLEQLLVILAPYAPHISEELWHQLGSGSSILDAPYPKVQETYLTESSKTYPIAVNGKTRTEITISLEADQKQVESIVLADEIVQKWLDDKSPKKIIYVKNKMINIVI